MAEKLLTPAEAATLKGVSRPTIYSAMADGRLPSVRMLGRLALRERDVLAWQPVTYAGRPGVPGRGGRPKGIPASQETKQKIAEVQRKRWSRQKEVENPVETYVAWRGFQDSEELD